MVSLGEYQYSKTNRSVVRKGMKRNRDQGDMDMSDVSKVVWTQRSSDPQEYATDVASILRYFTGDNFEPGV